MALFILGLAVIVDALASNGQNVAQLLVGALLIGIIPLDELLARVGRRDGHRRRWDDPVSSEGGETD